MEKTETEHPGMAQSWLRRWPIRPTPQRFEIARALLELGDWSQAEEIQSRVKLEPGPMSLNVLTRQLQAMLEAGAVEVLEGPPPMFRARI